MAGLTEETDLMDSFEDMHPRDDEAIQDPLKRDNLRAIDVEQYTG